MNIFNQGQLIQVKRTENHKGKNDVAVIESISAKRGKKYCLYYDYVVYSLRFRETGKTAEFLENEINQFFELYTPTIEEKINNYFKSDESKPSRIKIFFSWLLRIFERKKTTLASNK